MRKLIYSLFVSLDGYVETPDHRLDWATIDEEVQTFVNQQSRGIDLSLYGRRLYELMIDYWPSAEENPSTPGHEAEYARIWKATQRLVFSKTLKEVAWNSTLVREIIPEEIRKLKEQPGKDIEIGGPALAAQFIRLGLVDEYQPYVFPVVLGGGTPFFPPLDNPINLRLIEQRQFRSGATSLRYEAAQSP